MSSQNRARFIVDLTGNVAQQARRFGASIRSLGADGSRSMRVFRGAMGFANGALDKFDNRLTGLVTGGGMMMLAKNVGNTQQQLTEVSTRYNMVADQAAAFDSALWKNAADYKMVQGSCFPPPVPFLKKPIAQTRPLRTWIKWQQLSRVLDSVPKRPASSWPPCGMMVFAPLRK